MRDELAHFLVVVFAVFWLGAFFTSQFPLISTKTFTLTNKTNQHLPPYVHLILDEHIGVEGVPASDAENYAFIHSLKDKYIQQGFKVFGKAYSRDLRSIDSFASFLNFASLEHPEKYLREGKISNILTKNALFEALSAKGYQLNVIRSSYLDFCQSKGEISHKKCTTYRQTAPIPENGMLSTKEKTVAILNNVFAKLHLSSQFTRIKKTYLWALLSLPQMNEIQTVDSSSAAYKAFAEVLDSAKHIEKGNAYFIHLLLPHRPYIFDKDCHFVGDRGIKTAEYFEQLKCSHKLVANLLDSLASNSLSKNSIIVIHGDHGSRIQEPAVVNHQFTAENFIQTFKYFFHCQRPLQQAWLQQ